MKLLMISGDNSIMNEKSEAYARQLAYARMCEELHIIVMTSQSSGMRTNGNLFLHPTHGNKIIQRIATFRIARELLRSRHIDMVTAQSPDEIGLVAYVVAQSFFVPLQLQVHMDILSPWYRSVSVISRGRYVLARFLLRRANCVRVVSQRIARSLVQELGIRKSSLALLPIFTDVQAIMREGTSFSQDLRVKDKECAMIAVGRFVDKEKNFSMLIRAMKDVVKECPNSVLYLVGEGRDKEMYRSLILRLGLKDHVILEPWREDLATFYRSFDLFVVSSYIEGWGRAAIEAMAAGLPVVMTDVGVAGEVVKDGINGLVVPVNDQSALARALITMAKNTEQRKMYGNAARDAVLELWPAGFGDYLKEWKKSFECCSLTKHNA